MKKIIKNIAELIQVEDNPKIWVAGKEMSSLKTIKDAFLEIENGKIIDFGSMNEWKGVEDWNKTEIIDAKGGMVFPSYCDSHTHLVFAKNREKEFIDKINGLSYQEIANRGGGILNSVEALRDMSEDDLYEISLNRLNEVIKLGTGAIEIKTGYGLSMDSELKILRVIQRLKEKSKATIKSTLLAAHAVPNEYKGDKESYLNLVINEILPEAVKNKLIDYIDIFCEKNYFSVNDMNRLLIAAKEFNIKAKVHVNQFNSIGGVSESVKQNVLSVDHLEVMKEEDFKSLADSNCMPTALPGCSFFLGISYTPAREIIDKGLPLALASDYNPGSSPSGNMNFISSLGCIKLKMNPEEVINSTTINSAYAMDLSESLGSISKGKKANLFITKPISSYSYLAYNFSNNLIDKIILEGELL